MIAHALGHASAMCSVTLPYARQPTVDWSYKFCLCMLQYIQAIQAIKPVSHTAMCSISRGIQPHWFSTVYQSGQILGKGVRQSRGRGPVPREQRSAITADSVAYPDLWPKGDSVITFYCKKLGPWLLTWKADVYTCWCNTSYVTAPKFISDN